MENRDQIRRHRFNLYKFLVLLLIATFFADRYFDKSTVDMLQIFLFGFAGLAIIFEIADYLERKKQSKKKDEDDDPGTPVHFYREKDVLGNDKP